MKVLGRLIFAGLVLVSLSIVSACGTELNTPEARDVKNLIARYCHISRGSQAIGRTRVGDIGSDVVIHSITHGEGGWVMYDTSTTGVRDVVYHNKNKGKIVCGWRNWRRSGRNFEKK